jgi:hypothetical protein
VTIRRVWVWSLVVCVLGSVLVTMQPRAAPVLSSAAVLRHVAITDFKPRLGGLGTSVTIRGANFTHVTSVAFNGARATHYSIVSRSRIVATVPAAAQTGPIRVTTSSGSATTKAAFRAVATFEVYVGYYDTHHLNNPQPKPDPWLGSPNTLFIGEPDSNGGGWDSSAIRIDNLSDAPLTGVIVTVDIGSRRFALWGRNTIPAHQTMILAQRGYETFDGSDTNAAGCYGCDPEQCVSTPSNTIPVVHVTINSETANLPDANRVLNTQGVDKAGCPPTAAKKLRNDESEPWSPIS